MFHSGGLCGACSPLLTCSEGSSGSGRSLGALSCLARTRPVKRRQSILLTLKGGRSRLTLLLRDRYRSCCGDALHQDRLFALCDDGSVWLPWWAVAGQPETWTSLASIPQGDLQDQRQREPTQPPPCLTDELYASRPRHRARSQPRTPRKTP